jgi:ATP/maltotriose-dependent transcriptional regulator MalT
MTWEELYPVVKEQAYYAVLRYDARRADKVQELICQSYAKYQNDLSKGKEIKKQDYKYFVSSRSKQLDIRSFVKKKGGGVSTLDALGYIRRRADSPTPVIEFAEWMSANALKKDSVEESISFKIDFSNWQLTLSKIERRILNMLLNGYTAQKIADKVKLNYMTVRDCIKKMKEAFIKYFHISHEVLVV